MDFVKAQAYDTCHLCPRYCGVNRTKGAVGFCGRGASFTIASAVVHRGEEPPLISGKGSGTIFFTGCTLRCPFCQNSQISSEGMGTEVDDETFMKICTALTDAGAGNINLVTGTPFIPTLARCFEELRSSGFTLPVVWNSSGFESPEGLEILSSFVDIYLLDMKVATREASAKLFSYSEYGEIAQQTALFAADRAPLSSPEAPDFHGTILRHLVMPGFEDETKRVIRWFGEHLAGKALFSLMLQFVDTKGTKGTEAALTEDELLRLLDEAGIEDGFLQEPGDDSLWLPDFARVNPFPKEYADPVWHWKHGFLDTNNKTVDEKDVLL
ncbi:MAG: 4Fe-4S cluster-binding domain-containing protein [Spirochaetales bacterium]|nr:4Fe-4S cluster-binding domain-containing protein [Spirochaetales bacterium]